MIETFGAALVRHPPRRTETGCLEWTGPVNNSGYGVIVYYRDDGTRSSMPVHRVALVASGVQMAPKDVACHTCDNRRCIELRHVYPAPQRQNLADMRARGRDVKRVSKPRDEWGVRFLALKQLSVEAVAKEFGVTLRTALRWQQKLRATTSETM